MFRILQHPALALSHNLIETVFVSQTKRVRGDAKVASSFSRTSALNGT